MFGFFKEQSQVNAVIQKKFDIIFYAENAYSFQYMSHLFFAFREKNLSICYITSQKNDPVFSFASQTIQVVYSHSTLAFLFQRLKGEMMFMTMPDLDRFLFKRSQGVKKYIYVFHALVSMHQQYREHAFDHYDTILLAGPHHEKEIGEWEKIHNLPSKELIPYGYPLLQSLKQKIEQLPTKNNRFLLAPSWYEEGILQTCLVPLLEEMKKENREVIIRPHPEFIKRNQKLYRQLKELSGKNELILDGNAEIWESLLSSEYLVTDRSGIAFEFAFVKNHPVLFIDTPLKKQNKSTVLSLEPVENQYRNEIGVSISPRQLKQFNEAVGIIERDLEMYRDKIREVQTQMVYSPDHQDKAIQILLGQASV